MEIFTKKTKDILTGFRFDEIPFEQLRKKLKTTGYRPSDFQFKSKITPLASKEISQYPVINSKQYTDYKNAGENAIKNGQVAVAILNGGMATRFGGIPKGAVHAAGTRSFIDLKISQAMQIGGSQMPVFLMNSHATELATLQHLKKLKFGANVKNFRQFVSLRLMENGEYFLTENAQVSPCSSGHGDFPYALNNCTEFKKFVSQGGKYITLSNVDNLGASLDPVIIGSHIANCKSVSVELVKTQHGDTGGFPAGVDKKTCIVEGFRLPSSFDKNFINIFNTNTFVFNVETIAEPPELEWFFVKKEVDNTQVIQFERLVGQMTEHFNVNWILVSRTGAESRFVPIKVLADLETRKSDLHAVLLKQGVL